MEGKRMLDNGTLECLHIERCQVWIGNFAFKQECADDQSPLTFMSFEIIGLVCIFLDLIDGHFQARDTLLWEWTGGASEVFLVPRSFSCFLRSQKVCQIVSLGPGISSLRPKGGCARE